MTKEFNFRHVTQRCGIPSTNENNWAIGQMLAKMATDRGIEPNRILTKKTDPGKGDIILYENKGAVVHAGIMESRDVVISKWSWGPLVKHHIFCVPAHYGNKISFYKKPDSENLIQIINFGKGLDRDT